MQKFSKIFFIAANVIIQECFDINLVKSKKKNLKLYYSLYKLVIFFLYKKFGILKNY